MSRRAAYVEWTVRECQDATQLGLVQIRRRFIDTANTLLDAAVSVNSHRLTDGRLLARLSRLIDTAPALPAAQRFAAHLDGEFPAVLAFLWAPDVDATNWRAEHANEGPR